MVVVLVVLLVAAAGLAVYNVSKARHKDASPRVSASPTGSPAASATPIDETASWNTYTNTDLGYSFKYPKQWGDVQFKVTPVEVGKTFTGTFTKLDSTNKFESLTSTWERPIGGPALFAWVSHFQEALHHDRVLPGPRA